MNKGSIYFMGKNIFLYRWWAKVSLSVLKLKLIHRSWVSRINSQNKGRKHLWPASELTRLFWYLLHGWKISTPICLFWRPMAFHESPKAGEDRLAIFLCMGRFCLLFAPNCFRRQLVKYWQNTRVLYWSVCSCTNIQYL